MSYWTKVNGNIVVEPMGDTQAEIRYVLDSVLEHLPIVSGSEGCMDVYIIQKNGHNRSSSHDEYGYATNNLTDSYGHKSRRYGWLRAQTQYILVVNGRLRDRKFDQTLKEFNKWLCRLAKRVRVEDVLVEIEGYDEKILIKNENNAYRNMYEKPSWHDDKSENWCERLF